jgi:hypothetical protein
MGLDIKQFQAGLDFFAQEEVPKEFKRRQIEIMIYAYKLVQDRTPVYKGPDFPGGHAASNWRLSTIVKDDVLGTRSAPTRNIPTETIRQYLTPMKVGETLWLYNNVPYMVYLDAGTSMQAPAYFIEICIEDTINYMNSRGWT